jgi:hypothetical protein
MDGVKKDLQEEKGKEALTGPGSHVAIGQRQAASRSVVPTAVKL